MRVLGYGARSGSVVHGYVDFLSLRDVSRAELFYEDQDSFLPSAIQRYHQLFMPALQLVAAMLTTLGAQHATASSQVRLISEFCLADGHYV
jgi:hypothetical protein